MHHRNLGLDSMVRRGSRYNEPRRCYDIFGVAVCSDKPLRGCPVLAVLAGVGGQDIMKITSSPPDVIPSAWYNTTDTISKLGMSRTTFWRISNAGKIKRKMRHADGNFWYRGKDILTFWNKFK